MNLLPCSPPRSWVPVLLLLAPIITLGCDAPSLGMLATPAEASEPAEIADPLLEFLRAPLPSEPELEAALEALKATFESPTPAAALSRLASLQSTLPAVADWIPLFEAELLAKAGNVEGVQRALDRLGYDTGIRERWGAPTLMQAIETTRGAVPPAWVEAVERLVRTSADDGGRAAVLDRLASRIESTERGRARSLRIEALGTAPGSRGALAAARALAPGLEVDGNPDLQRQVAEELERHDRWSTSVPLRRALLAGGMGSPSEPGDRVALARAQAESGDGTGALGTLRGAGGAGAEESAVHVLSLYTVGRESEGLTALRALAASHPTHQATARVLLGRGLLEVERNPARARELFLLLATSGHRPPAADEVVLALGLRLYEGGRFADAASLLEAFAVGHPRPAPRQQALYWAGLSLGREGDLERRNELLRAARVADPISYYGARAARLVGVPFLPQELPAGPENSPEVTEEELANAVIRLRVHVGVPTAGSYAWELERLTRYFGAKEGGLHALGEAMVARGIPLQAARFVRMVAGDPGGTWDARLLKTAFPFPFEEEIRASSQEAGVDPYFVAGLIRQESLFQARIRSHAGATGLMQIMPATGRGLARQMGLRGFQLSDLEHPGTNVAMGTRYIAQQLQRYGGREADALAAYNAGSGRMNRWRSLPEYRDPDLWVERIPFAETRGYVKAVTLNWSIYSSLYGCGLEGLEYCPHPVTAMLRSGSGAVNAESSQR